VVRQAGQRTHRNQYPAVIAAPNTDAVIDLSSFVQSHCRRPKHAYDQHANGDVMDHEHVAAPHRAEFTSRIAIRTVDICSQRQ